MMPGQLDRLQALSLDEQLHVFLAKWESARAGQIAKYTLRVEHDRQKLREGAGGYEMILHGDLSRLRDHEHELAMLRELRRRALLNTFTQSE